MEFVKKTLIEKGWSGDKKYCAVTADGKKYLLRITPHGSGKNRKEMFEMQKKLDALGVPMCRPIEIGECDDGTYVIQSWIEGQDANEIIPHIEDSQQYALGMEAGRILKKIHSVPAPDEQPDWEIRFNNKMNRKIQMYNDCPIKFDGAEHIINYIESNRHLLRNRPQCYQHGDYHIGNMMIENGHIIIIDFDRYDYGDPWEEFNRIVWCAQSCPVFATGIVNGYFDGNVPFDFWKLLALYISSNTLSSVPWAIPFGDGEIQTMLNQAKDVLSWYDDMQNPVPTWYMPYIETINQYAETYSDPPERERIAGRGIVVRDGKILLSHELNTGVYMTPGGGIEEGETLEDCCRREVREESGYEVEPLFQFLKINEYSFETKYVSNYFLCEVTGEGKQTLTDIEIEHGIVPEWVSIEDALAIFGTFDEKTPDVRSLYIRELTTINKYLEINRTTD